MVAAGSLVRGLCFHVGTFAGVSALADPTQRGLAGLPDQDIAFKSAGRARKGAYVIRVHEVRDVQFRLLTSSSACGQSDWNAC